MADEADEVRQRCALGGTLLVEQAAKQQTKASMVWPKTTPCRRAWG